MRERSTYLKWQRALIFQTVIRGGVRVQEPGHEATLPQTETDLILMAKRSHQVGGVGGGGDRIRSELQSDVLLAWAGRLDERRQGWGQEGFPCLSSPSPTCLSTARPHQLLPAYSGWSWVGCGSCQNSNDTGKLSHTSDFQARVSLVPELGKATLMMPRLEYLQLPRAEADASMQINPEGGLFWTKIKWFYPSSVSYLSSPGLDFPL